MNALRRTWPAAVALVALLSFCLGQARAADNETRQPKIQFTELLHNFGKAAANSQLQTAFTFKNTGKAQLLIQEVKAG
jgi:hypothetical protein